MHPAESTRSTSPLPLAQGAGRIMLVEDEPQLQSLLSDYLQQAGYEVASISDGRDVIAAVRQHAPDLLLLDLMLPGRGGLDICRELREFSALPVIIITARIDEVDRLIGLEIGADDYICKPFSPREVVARTHAVLRRVRRAGGSMGLHGLRIDEQLYRAEVGGKTLELTPVEFRLLKTLTDAPGRVFSRQQLLDRLYADHRVVTDRTVDSHIKNLRRKLQAILPEQEMIHSVYGVGYKLEV